MASFLEVRSSSSSEIELPRLSESEKPTTMEALATVFDIGPVIGSGNFSTVRLVTDRASSHQYAMKFIDKSLYVGRESSLKSELTILKRVRHPHIVSLHEEYDIGSHLCLLFTYAAGGELFDRIIEEVGLCNPPLRLTSQGSFTEKDASRVIRQIAEALRFLHSQGIVHRDLKVRQFDVVMN